MNKSASMYGLVAAMMLACAPALDWREVRPPGSGIAVLFPCKPDSHARQVQLGSDTVRLELHACNAAGATWALAFADVGDPARVGTALVELRNAAARNLDASQSDPLPLAVPGATPNPASQRLQLRGRMPDGRVVSEQVAVFSHGTRVFQATAVADRLDAESADGFFASLRFTP